MLRTPLTGLRLELEDLAERDDVPADVRESATRSVGRIDAMDAVAGDLVALARRGALVAGAEIPLRDLATQCAQTWADALAEQDRPLTAAVEGNIETTYTPGPVEHILDLLLADVLRRGQGAVRMVFEADEEGHLSIGVSCAELRAASVPNADIAITQARAVVTALGGRLTGGHPGAAVDPAAAPLAAHRRQRRRHRAGQEATGVPVRPGAVEVVDAVVVGLLADVDHLAGQPHRVGVGRDRCHHPGREVRRLGRPASSSSVWWVSISSVRIQPGATAMTGMPLSCRW